MDVPAAFVASTSSKLPAPVPLQHSAPQQAGGVGGVLRSPVSLGALALGLWRCRRSKPLTRRYDVAEPRMTSIHLEQAEQAAVRKDQKLCIITGGTSRMGSAIARGLAGSGRFERILLLGRNHERGESIVKELKDKVGVQVDFQAVDLADQAQVSQFCKSLGDQAVHTMVLAAGVTALEDREETCDGHEMHFGLNYLSRFNMVGRLMKNLEKGGTPEDPSKILLCSSSRHRGEPQLGFAGLGAALPLAMGNLDDLQLEAYGAYRPWKAFGQAALCNVMFAYELQRRLPAGGPVTVSCFDPGPMTTAWDLYKQEENRWLSAGMSSFEKELFSYFTRLVQTPEEAAETAIALATDATLPGRHPGAPQVGFANYWENGMPALSKVPLPWNWGNSYDDVTWNQLWQHSQHLLENERK